MRLLRYHQSILCSLFLEVFTLDVAPTAVLKHCFIALTVAMWGRNCSEQTSMIYECQEFQVCSTLYMFVPQGLHAVKGDLDWIRNWKVNLGFSSPGSFSSVFLRTFGKNATWKANVRLSQPWSTACLLSQSKLVSGTWWVVADCCDLTVLASGPSVARLWG